MWTLVGAAAVLTGVGCIFYGPRALLLAATCGSSAAVTEAVCCWLYNRRWDTGMAHSLAMGLLVGLMLPATAPWYVAAAGAMLSVAVGKWLMGGLGHYPWNPAVVAVLLLHLLWPESITPQRWPLLSRDNILVDNVLRIDTLSDRRPPLDWAAEELPDGTIGFSVGRADAVLQDVSASKDAPGHPTLDTAIRDLLPSCWDVLTGAVAGPIGEGSVLAIAFVGVGLIWRGYLRWAMPLSVLCGAFAAAAVLPVADAGWLPIRHITNGMPLGLVWVAYQVLLGPTLFTAVMLAGETVTSPMTRRGQIIYGLGVGVLTVGLRWWPVAMLSGCWAVLAMNTLVPMIERLERRWRVRLTV